MKVESRKKSVRDGKDGISPELVKELSRNLFANAPGGDGLDVHPQAFSDLLMQNLSSVKIKTPGGSEVEATRSKMRK